MAYEILIDHARNLITVTAHGVINLDNVLQYAEELVKEPYLSLPYDIIVDYRNADQSPVSNEDVYAFIDFLKANSAGFSAFNMAIVTTGDLEFGLNRMFQMLTEGEFPFHVYVTKDIQEAHAWAGLHPNAIPVDGLA